MIFADFNNRDADGFLRLNTVGTVNDLAIQAIILRDGLRLSISDGDLAAEIIVRPPGNEGVWRGEIVRGPFDCQE